MATSEKKKELLLQSFDILKNDLEKNSDKIKELIGKVAKFDLHMAIEMWNYILIKGEKYLKDSDTAYRFAGGVIYEIKTRTNKHTILQILKDNRNIAQQVFGESGDICISTLTIISESLKIRDVELADKLLELVYENKNKERSFGEIFEEVCEYTELDDDDEEDEDDNVSIAEVVVKWAEKIKDSERKARIMVSLVDFL